MKHKPPVWADKFLQWYCRIDLLEEIQGDAYELFHRKAKEHKTLAKIQFVWNVLRFFRLKNIRKISSHNNNALITYGMLKNIIKVALRNFIKQPGHSLLSMTGLSVSFICAFFVMLWLAHEFSFDQFHNESQRIFKVLSHVETNSSLQTYDAAAVGLDVSSMPEVGQHAPVINGSRWPNELCFRPSNKNNECIYLNGIYSKSTLFSVFDFSIVHGDKDPFIKKESIAISKKMAQSLFNETDVVGKILNIDTWFDVTITAVFEDIPSNSSLQFDFVMPIHIFQRLRGVNDDQVADQFAPAYIKTNKDITPELLSEKLNLAPALTEKLKIDKVSYSAFPLSDWRLRGKFENGQSVGGRIEYVRLFIILAGLVVVMAIINFINLNTARATNRSKEIGIRKVTGALRSSIIFQFIGESVIIITLAFIAAIIFTHLSLPFFSSIIGEELSVRLLSGWLPIYLLVFLLAIALVAGLYPAFIMSSFQPATVLKGSLIGSRSGGKHFRKMLLVVQLSASIGIVIFSSVIFQQLQFIQTKNLGYDRNNMIRIEPTYKLLQQYDAFKHELLSNASIKSITAANSNPLSLQGHTTGISWSGKPEDMRVTFQTLGCNYEFLETFGLTILKGRSFQPKTQDTVNHEIIITEEAVKVMGLSNPIGEIIYFANIPCIIIGVVNDFHTESLRNEKLPIILYPQPILNCSAIFIKYEEGDIQKTLEGIQAVYKKFEPSFSMKFWFQDDTFNNIYKTELIASRMVVGFTTISLIIAVIGVVGLATYNVIRKRKEIGIKRVFGASIPSILGMLSREFVGIILIATLLAAPFAWYGANEWLNGFAYHIDMPWWVFFSAFAGISLLTIVIICLQGVRTAASNPVHVLRSE
jgi:putative ABC transport system permease protein